MRFLLTAAVATAVTGSAAIANAAELTVSVEVPKINVAEYHRPYVAIWLEDSAGKVTNLAVWYNVNNTKKEGEKWLKDMRQWWRKSGRELAMPVDGLSSPTRAPGTHQVRFDGAASPLKALAPGNYKLVVEAAREVGGRELVSLPFQWPAGGATSAITADAKGSSELGTVKLSLK